jgi:uncharacterized membrane protein YhhN
VTNIVELGLATAGVIALADWVAIVRADERLERVAKPAVMVVLIATVLISDPSASTRSLLLGAALFGSLMGDLLLLPPERFEAGLVAFLGAHLAYLAVFATLGPLRLDLAILGLAIGLVIVATVGRAILRGAIGAGIGAKVAAYLAVIVAMATAATSSGLVLAGLGAWLFVASDAVLGWDRFAAAPASSPAARTSRRLAVMVSYHVAQLLLVAAVLSVT